MYLQGQDERPTTAIPDTQGGFAMAALLVAIGLLGVMLLVALPAWSHQARREKEIELIFRGEQYARAIGLYRRKLAGANPPSLDALVEGKFLRRKYVDPLSGEDFQPIFANAPLAQAAGTQAATDQAPGATQQSGSAPPAPQSQSPGAQNPGGQTFRGPGQGGTSREFGSAPAGGGVGIVGVIPSSKGPSIRIYNGQQQYDQWLFVARQSAQTAPQGGTGQPGEVDGQGRGRGAGRGLSGPGVSGPRGRGSGG